jgi:predicted RNA-binding protein associated with RNAse of E/G family
VLAPIERRDHGDHQRVTDEGPPLVHIHYLRPPDREQVFTQYLISDQEGVKVTYANDLEFDPPIRIAGGVVLETGSEVIWFTFPGAWHDIGIFHRADGSVTGIYANILTPCVFEEGGVWRTTDLFLDLWIDPEGHVRTLDEDELEEAEAKGWVESDTAHRARKEVKILSDQASAGDWPPKIVGEWTLARARGLIA